MRIISGKLGGRQFMSPNGNRTHPMSDKVRNAIFNTLGDISGLDILDAFSGSGAVGLESISRGARSVVSIDNSRQAQITIEQNVKALGLKTQHKLIKASISAWISTSIDSFDIVIADPPFDNISVILLDELSQVTQPGGIFVVHLPKGYELDLKSNLELLVENQYGDSKLKFYRLVN